MTIKMMTSTKGCTSNSTRFLSNRSSSSMTVSYVVVVVTLLLLNNGIVGTVAQSNTHSNTTHHSSPTSPPVSSTATTPTSPPTAASKCPMTCQHGGHCKVGTADYSMHPVEPSGLPFIFLMETSKDGWYCDCPVGHTGIHCGRPYVTCPDPDNSTSPHYCYHGGQCVEGLANSTAVAEHHRFCNCSAAQYNGIPYFGKYCEIEGAHKCSADSDVFCTAHGTCKDGFETMAHPCECPAGYRGPHCEFLRGQVPDCTLTCHHGGECTLGLKDFEVAQYEEFWSSHDGNFQHCQCTEGWFGDTCNVTGTKCGSAHCFHGGSCLQTMNANHQTTYACDCRTAGNNGTTFAAAGQYCEAHAMITCQNEKNNPNGHLFCTNGGTCKANPHEGCHCPANFHGHSCEFTSEEDAKCSLTCQNGGTCRNGLKDQSMVNAMGKELSNFNDTHSGRYEHCVCPDGYFGIQCEHKLEICPGGEHVCLHGSKCVAENESGEDGTKLTHKCDCDHAFNAVDRFAGKYCQYSSTDICTKSGKPGVGKANFAFCVNNGSCRARVNDNEAHPGCDCSPEFFGDHCEYLKSSGTDGTSAETQPPTTTSASSSTDAAVIGISLTLMVVIVTAGICVIRALCCGGRVRGGKSNNADVGAAVAEEEAASSKSVQTLSANGTGGTTTSSFEEGGVEDIEDYSNGSSMVTEEEGMTNVQIV